MVLGFLDNQLSGAQVATGLRSVLGWERKPIRRGARPALERCGAAGTAGPRVLLVVAWLGKLVPWTGVGDVGIGAGCCSLWVSPLSPNIGLRLGGSQDSARGCLWWV